MTPDEPAFARGFIAQIEPRFTYARSLSEHPHEYVARAWLTPELQAGFDAVVALIERDGYTGRFWEQAWTYLDVGA